MLEGSSNGKYSFIWSPVTGLSNATLLRPTATPVVSTLYTIRAVNNHGCADSAKVMVKVQEKVYVPNAFSPNGDGLNDSWIIDNIEDYPGSDVRVYNRWGNVVIRIKDYTPANAWDGMVNGLPVPIATYYYIIDLNDGLKPIQENITIIR